MKNEKRFPSALVFFFLARPRLRWLLFISVWWTLLWVGESFAGAVAIDSSMHIYDVGFRVTGGWHASLAASPPWVLDALASLNSLPCVVVLTWGLVKAVNHEVYGLIVCMYSLLTFRLFLGLCTALPKSPEYLYSIFDQPNAMASAFIHLYSGHCSLMSMCGFWLWTRHKHLAVLVHMCNILQCTFMLTTRGHYTIDLVVALVVGIWAAGHVDNVSHFFQRQEEFLLRQCTSKSAKVPPRQNATTSTTTTLSPSTAKFRAHYREQYPYPAWLQAGGLLACYTLSLTFCGWMISSSTVSARYMSSVTFFVGLILANGLEYVLHGLWQHRTHDKSHLEHHQFFPKASMHAETVEDLYAIVQELYSAVFIVLAVFPCMSLVLGYILARFAEGGPGATFHFALYAQMSFTLYYMCSEAVHFYHHRPPPPPAIAGSVVWSWCCQLMQVPPFSWVKHLLNLMSAHHIKHHDQALMHHHNRNINFPLFDYLFGTKK